MTKRNILFINERPFNPILGGIERVTDVITKALLAKGQYSVYYLCGKINDNETEYLNYDFPAILYTLPEDRLFASEKNIEFIEKFKNGPKSLHIVLVMVVFGILIFIYVYLPPPQ